MSKAVGRGMQPVPHVVFVKETPYEIKKNKFDYVGEAKKHDYIVTAIGYDVSACEVGDYVLFDNYHEYEFQGEKIIKVNESDIHGVASSLPPLTPSVEIVRGLR